MSRSYPDSSKDIYNGMHPFYAGSEQGTIEKMRKIPKAELIKVLGYDPFATISDNVVK